MTMKHILVVMVGTDWVRTDLVGIPFSPVLRRALKPWVRREVDEDRPTTFGSTERTFSATSGSLQEALECCLHSLAEGGFTIPNGCGMEVHLGLAYSRVGVIQAAPDAEPAAAIQLGDALVAAWVRQTWAIDPSRHVVRWQVLERPQRILVSCIDRDTYELLERFAQVRGLRFVSCLPAILNAAGNGLLGHQDADSALSSTICWTERATGGARASTVQLFGLHDGEIRAAWRGWLPPVGAPGGLDREIQGAVRRFLACHAIEIDSPTHILLWPFSAARASGVKGASHV